MKESALTQSDLRKEIVDHLKQTKKYQYLCEDALYRVAEWAQSRHPSLKAATKAAKRKLHQVYGAYLDQADLTRAAELVDGLEGDVSESHLEQTCSKILKCHASTAERLPILADFYPALFRMVGIPATLLDLACGLNPFALPWMALKRSTEYIAVDVDERLTSLIDRFFGRMGQPARVKCGDILTGCPDPGSDMVLLLKTIPILEQQKKGSGLDLLKRLESEIVVVSFPAQSLGGREKGMGSYYESAMKGILAELRVGVRKMAYPGETFYVLEG